MIDKLTINGKDIEFHLTGDSYVDISFVDFEGIKLPAFTNVVIPNSQIKVNDIIKEGGVLKGTASIFGISTPVIVRYDETRNSFSKVTITPDIAKVSEVRIGEVVGKYLDKGINWSSQGVGLTSLHTDNGYWKMIGNSGAANKDTSASDWRWFSTGLNIPNIGFRLTSIVGAINASLKGAANSSKIPNFDNDLYFVETGMSQVLMYDRFMEKVKGLKLNCYWRPVSYPAASSSGQVKYYLDFKDGPFGTFKKYVSSQAGDVTFIYLPLCMAFGLKKLQFLYSFALSGGATINNPPDDLGVAYLLPDGTIREASYNSDSNMTEQAQLEMNYISPKYRSTSNDYQFGYRQMVPITIYMKETSNVSTFNGSSNPDKWIDFFNTYIKEQSVDLIPIMPAYDWFGMWKLMEYGTGAYQSTTDDVDKFREFIGDFVFGDMTVKEFFRQLRLFAGIIAYYDITAQEIRLAVSDRANTVDLGVEIVKGSEVIEYKGLSGTKTTAAWLVKKDKTGNIVDEIYSIQDKQASERLSNKVEVPYVYLALEDAPQQGMYSTTFLRPCFVRSRYFGNIIKNYYTVYINGERKPYKAVAMDMFYSPKGITLRESKDLQRVFVITKPLSYKTTVTGYGSTGIFENSDGWTCDFVNYNATSSQRNIIEYVLTSIPTRMKVQAKVKVPELLLLNQSAAKAIKVEGFECVLVSITNYNPEDGLATLEFIVIDDNVKQRLTE
ncbi:MAG: hypothetical protein KatS3mg087_1887 [Patescibacteria group bacterium]|nr:MAG: hypothetical protein KatS3mg087_1887 [Patescibacteria group bacterium]